MHSEYHQVHYEQTDRALNNPINQGSFIRKLTFVESSSPPTTMNNYLEDLEFDMLMNKDKDISCEPQISNPCYKKLCFGNDNEIETEDTLFSSSKPHSDGDRLEFDLEEDFSEVHFVNQRGLSNGAEVDGFEIKRSHQSESNTKSSESLLLREKCISEGLDDKLLELLRINSQDAFQYESAVKQRQQLFPAMEPEPCFYTTPKKLLPTCSNYRNPDLHTITCQTMIDLMGNSQRQPHLVIDCRYDYEYHGGHIKDAIHIDSPQLLELFLIVHRRYLFNRSGLNYVKKNFQALKTDQSLFNSIPIYPAEDCVPILIFHCEFSQKRGPRALRMLRELDRQLNHSNWPNLAYPEVYLLEGGYKNFHSQYTKHCCPENSYIGMIDERYQDMYAQARQEEKKCWESNKAEPKKSLRQLCTPQRSKTMTEIKLEF